MDRRTVLATAAAVTLGGCASAVDRNEEDDERDPLPPGPLGPGVFEDFRDLSSWETVEGSAEVASDGPVRGADRARLRADGSAGGVRIVGEFAEPADLSALAPGLTLSVDRPTAPFVQLYDDRGHVVEYRQPVAESSASRPLSLGVARGDGPPDLEEVTEIHVGCWAGGEADVELTIRDLHFAPRPRPGVATIQFDGGFETDYVRGLPVLEAHDLSATTFVATDRIRGDVDHEGDRLTEDQVAALADAGWTIASHSARGLPLTALEGDEAAADVASAAEWLATEGYEEGARFFSFPGGQYDEAIRGLVRDHHDLAFAGRFPAQGRVTDPHGVTRVAVRDADHGRELLDLTAELGGITPLVFHELDGDGEAALEATAERLRALEADGELEVATPAELAAEYAYRIDSA